MNVMNELTPLGAVVLLHDVSHLLTGQEEVSRLLELEVHGVFIQYAEVILKGCRRATVTLCSLENSDYHFYSNKKS